MGSAYNVFSGALRRAAVIACVLLAACPGWASPQVRRAIDRCAELGGVWHGSLEPPGPGCFRTVHERIPLGDAEYTP